MNQRIGVDHLQCGHKRLVERRVRPVHDRALTDKKRAEPLSSRKNRIIHCLNYTPGIALFLRKKAADNLVRLLRAYVQFLIKPVRINHLFLPQIQSVRRNLSRCRHRSVIRRLRQGIIRRRLQSIIRCFLKALIESLIRNLRAVLRRSSFGPAFPRGRSSHCSI